MEMIRKLENAFAKLTKDLPHLPAGGRKWLGDNVWWIVIVGASITALATIINLVNLVTAINALNALSAFVAVGGISSWAITTTIISMAFVVVQVIVLGLAVQPLMKKQKKGWTLLFLTSLISAVALVVYAVISLNVVTLLLSLIFGAIFLAVGLYFVFEIREEFGAAAKKAESAKPAEKAATK